MFIIIFLIYTILALDVDPFIGTGGQAFGCGGLSPAAQLPYSMLRLGPDTVPSINKTYIDAYHFGGYSFYDRHIAAFSHLRMVGSGAADLGILGILPSRSVPQDLLR